ncbi:LCP family protein [Actinophytocola glycyrrhizae]|uniref:LCP family protein n=1 Tax=Actinophytocola glycyrrhizae TaxID=2044873 RepID=A0ABV9SC40_9PSEU
MSREQEGAGVNNRRSEGPVPGRGGQQPTPRAGRRTPPPANSGRVVGGRTGGDRDRREPPTERVPARARRDDERARPASRTSDARWQPRPEPAPRPRPRKRSRPALTGAKTAVAFLSVLILVGTGYYSNRLDQFTDGLTTRDVIDTPALEKPADGAIDILMVGMDSRTDAQGNPLSDEQLAMLSAGVADGEQNTDTLIMIRIPNDGGPAIGVSMPRDSYVDIPGYGQHKINSAYARAKNDAMARLKEEGMTDEAQLQVESNQEGAKKLIETVQELTGAGIDHYAEVNLLGFYDITNAIGGIDVCLNEAVDDEYSGARFPAGPQTLAGVQALAFVRQRHGLPNGDLDRIRRQQVFMSGMAKKVFSGDMLTPGSETLDKLQAAIQKSVVLDKNWDIMQFAQQMVGITGGNIAFETIPHGSIDLRTESDGSAVEVDPDEVRAYVSGLVGEQGDQAGGAEGGDDSSVDNSKTTVNVRNATDRSGLAGSVADELAADGFTKGEVGNADNRDSTVVRHATGEQEAGDRVATALGGNVQVEVDANLPAGSVTVLLGADYDGPGASGSDSAAGEGDGLSGKRLVDLSGGGPARAQPTPPANTDCVN